MGGGVGGFISGIFGSENEFKASQYQTDPNAYQYGGAPGGADEASNRYRKQAEDAQNRQGEKVDYTQANEDRGMQMQARQGQAGLAQAMQARAMGQVPSIAQQQADRQMGQATAAQASAGASARGAAGMALAQQNAAGNTANAQSAISNQAQINAANERMQAEQAAFGAYSGMRGQDLGSQSQSAQQQQYQSGLNAQQRQANDAFTMGMTQNEQNVRNSQLTAGMNQQSQNSANYNASQGINAGVSGQNSQTNQSNGAGLVSGIASVAGMAAMSDERAKTNVSDFVSSTWGTGRGVQPEQIAARENEAVAAGQAQRANLPQTGGFAVPGYSPGVRDPLHKEKYMSATQPLQQQDEERIGLAKAQQGQGIELNESEQQKLTAAQSRTSSDKKSQALGSNPAMGKSGGMGAGLSQAGEGFGKMAASVDTSFHPANTYSAPNLIPLQSGIEMKTGLQPLSTRGINPMGSYQQSDEREKEVVPLADDPVRGRLQMGHDRAFYAKDKDNDTRASLSGPSAPSHLTNRSAKSAPSLAKAMAPKTREKTPEELSAEADRLMGSMRSEHEARMSAGPSVKLTSDSRAKKEAFEQGAQQAAKYYTGEDITWGENGPEAIDEPKRELAPTVHALPPPPAPRMSGEPSAKVKDSPPATFTLSGHPTKGESRPANIPAFHELPPSKVVGPEGRYGVAANAEALADELGSAHYPANYDPQAGRERRAPEVSAARSLDVGGDSAGPAPALQFYAKRRERPATMGVVIPTHGRQRSLTSDERAKSVDHGPLANAARSMDGAEYEYKKPFTPPDQEPGEKNVGPMANNMAKDPVAGTIVKRDPSIDLPGGGLVLDQGKMVKTLGAIVADLQKQNDEDRKTIATLSSRMRGRR